jgi:hypothetical protein
MSFLNAKAVKDYLHEHNKQISKEAIEALNSRVEAIMLSAIRSTGHFKRITPTEINFNQKV